MITVETISANRYAPRGSEAVNLYSNGTEDGSHLTIGQLVIAVAMKSAAAYEAQSVTKMNTMTAGSDLLDQAAKCMDDIVNGNGDWSVMKPFLVAKLGIAAGTLPDNVDTYTKRLEAIGQLKAKVDELAKSQQQDMVDMQSLVNRRDTAYSASSNMVRSLGKAMNDAAGNF